MLDAVPLLLPVGAGAIDASTMGFIAFQKSVHLTRNIKDSEVDLRLC